MRNIFINDYHKAVHAQSVIDQDADVYNRDILNDSGFDTPDGSIHIQEITGAIDQLSEDLRVPFSLYVSGYKYNEIAGKLDMPLGTIKSRIFFARQEL
jgi:RNA polymerase sigma-70 factor (ECF subfamily)